MTTCRTDKSIQIRGLNGCTLTNLIVRGSLSAREVTEHYIRRIEEVNAVLNAVVVPLFEQARNQADSLDLARMRGESLGPLHGVPITVKESVDIAGTPSTLGLTDRIAHRASADAFQVSRLRQAGAVILGKTNVSLLLKAYESDNPVYGRTNNPWNLDRAPGGSSGGEGAIVAAGGSVLGLGSDFGGSIRLPAHACGVHAIRPTSGRLTMSGHARVTSAEGAMASQPAPIARSVADLDLSLRVLAASGQEFTDSSVAPVPLATVTGSKRLRVAFYTENGILRPAPAIRRAVVEAASALAALGAEVEEWQPPDLEEAWEIQLRLTCADGLASYRRALRNSKGQKVRLAAMPSPVRSAVTLLLQTIGQKKLAASLRFKHRSSVEQYFELVGRRQEYCIKFLKAFAARNFDVILCPPDALPAMKHGSSYYVSGCSVSYPGLYTLLGMPAGVVAATRVRSLEETERSRTSDLVERAARDIEAGSTGLPIGVQVAARHWRENIVLATMAMLESFFQSQPDFPFTPVGCSNACTLAGGAASKRFRPRLNRHFLECRPE